MSKKIRISLIVSLFFFAFGQAQDELFLKDGSSVKGSVITINKKKVYFEDAYTGKRKWYKKIDKLIDDIEGNKIEFKVRDINGLSNYLSGELVKGRLSYYLISKYVANPGSANLYEPIFYFYKDGDDKAFKSLPNSALTPFKKRMSKYFSDCPELINKINSEEFSYIDTAEIVEFYNSNCGI